MSLAEKSSEVDPNLLNFLSMNFYYSKYFKKIMSVKKVYHTEFS